MAGRAPLLLTGRKEHLEFFAGKGSPKHIFVLKGGMGKKQRRTKAEMPAAVPETEGRVIIATGSRIGEGFDEARLDIISGNADFLGGYASAVLWPAASAARRKACRTVTRLRRPERSNAGQNVRTEEDTRSSDTRRTNAVR